MATAVSTVSPPTVPQPRGSRQPQFQLDPNEPLGFPCRVFGATGPKWSGKTLLGMSIAPGNHPAGHQFAGQPRTLDLDFEMSGETYYSGAGVEYVDAHTALRREYSMKAYKPIDVFLWFRKRLAAIPVGRYDVIMADPVTDIENGLTDYVRTNPTEFGYTANQFAKSVPLLMGAVKAAWKIILLGEIAARCKMFYFTAHERMQFLGDRPTGKMEAKGKDTLYEIATMYVKLTREPPKNGEKPTPPYAVRLKDRWGHTIIGDDGELDIIEILPERIPECTPKALRHYVQHPVGKRKAKAEEVVTEKPLTDDEKLLLQAQISENNKEAASAELSRLDRMQAAAMAQAAGHVQQSQPQQAQQSNGQALEKLNAEIAEHDAKSPLCDDSQYQAIMHLIQGGNAYDSPEEFRAHLMGTYGAAVLKLLTRSQAVEVIDHLRGRIANKLERNPAAGVQQPTTPQPSAGSTAPAQQPASDPPATVPFVADAEQKTKPPEAGTAWGGEDCAAWSARAADERKKALLENNGFATKAQVDRMRGLVERLEMPLDVRERVLARYGVNSTRNLTVDQANELIDKLVKMELENSAGAAGPN